LDKCCLRVDLSSDLLITYFYWGVEEVPEGLTAADAIPKSEAVTQAQDFFDALGEGVKIRESDMVKYNDSMERVPGDLFGATWLVARIEGVDTGNVQVAFKFEVSAYSGRVEAYSRNPEWVPGKQE
ncbi:MAG: hypothetical protein QG656_240, partial [Candidatus Hydrogenedentes bacterium]|nr:hypothetical protein [Candidatus Hydrogenedentota bacterium]